MVCWKNGEFLNILIMRTSMYYDAIAAGYEELHREEQWRKVQSILDLLVIKKSDALLDVGCGTGFYLGAFPCKVMGVDPSAELLKQNPFPHLQATAESLPFPDSTFDIVISVTAIHNFQDIRKGLEEIRRVGKKRFALTVLKKSPKARLIRSLLEELFPHMKQLADEHDFIFLTPPQKL